ncbi:hypothetical protein RISK_006219 [Rhodopirellula islandica]|uniref:Uncharacterized protein n=1 Tax=Rhodopirellula islandica TaxID=595434 RepID=A0A0J1B4D0_RHOIS|nr:hypothetical protein RISK_006219 [Rhodopirellula islandica]
MSSTVPSGKPRRIQVHINRWRHAVGRCRNDHDGPVRGDLLFFSTRSRGFRPELRTTAPSGAMWRDCDVRRGNRIVVSADCGISDFVF